jgi:two-component system LytT family response regulator
MLQDYIYSKLKLTGFYLSESLLYNTFWIFFIPFSLLISRLKKNISPKNKWVKIPYHIGIGLICSLLHLLLFTALFVFVSHLVFSPTHHFSNIFNAALSNQFYITLLWYVLFPIIYSQKQTSSSFQYPENIKLKIGSKIINLPAQSIQVISTDKPYSVVFTNNQKFLELKSLKEFEAELNPSIFLRVHRSAIVNVTYIKELKSRSNGDYDALLQNGQIVRFSRHYRNNWHSLLQ